MTILGPALELHAAGYSVIPIRPDGSKAPAVAWKQYTTQQATVEQLHTWFTGDRHDLAIIQGSVSGGAELTELEGRAAHHLPELRELAHNSGIGELWDRVTMGWTEQSPSGGWHFHYRLVDAAVPGNQKIAKNSAGEILAETRGENGYVIVAPSQHHPTGNSWSRVIGSPDMAATITLEERADFHAVLATLDVQPEPAASTSPVPPHDPTEGVTPGDDYENKTDWADILEPAGWQLVFTRGRTRYWRRPGKTTGISATTGHADDRDRLFVFTSSTDFQQEIPYTKMGALAVLQYGGDHSATAKALYAAGYGNQATEYRLHAVTSPDAVFDDILGPSADKPHTVPDKSSVVPDAFQNIPATDGSLALAPVPRTAKVTTLTDRTMTLTDVGNAELFATQHAHHVRYVADRGHWLIWDGSRWAWDNKEKVLQLAKHTAESLDPTTSPAVEKHRTRSLSRRSLEDMLKVARSHPAIVVTTHELDADPYALNTPDGAVNLRTGTLTPPDPAALHSRSTLAAPDYDAATPLWDKFLAETFAGHEDVIPYLQRLVGYAATGVVTYHVLPFAHGSGANGKSVFLGVTGKALGDYASTANNRLLLAGATQHETEIARLAGMRMVVASEVNENDRFDEAKVKLLTGGDRLTSRFMRQDFFSFDPTHHLWVMGNEQPRVTTGGEAFWRRARLIPFTNTVPVDKRNQNLENELLAQEAAGILAWIIKGAVNALSSGLDEPDSVMAATKEYAAEEDQLGRFLEERTHRGSSVLRVQQTDLIAEYKRWCIAQGEQAKTSQALGRELKGRFGVQTQKSNSRKVYTGVALISDESEQDGEQWWQK